MYLVVIRCATAFVQAALECACLSSGMPLLLCKHQLGSCVSCALRYLGLTLAEWQQREEGGRLFGRKGRLYWLVSLQLCPAIWALIIGLVSLFLHKVGHCPKHSLLYIKLPPPEACSFFMNCHKHPVERHPPSTVEPLFNCPPGDGQHMG